ncbi:MAG: phosphopantothenoylcysteine decarboxylase [bacterium]
MLINQNVLITAGPTWTPIDEIRIITNIATGNTGCAIARKALDCGCNVTLVLGPGNITADTTLFGSIEVIRFKYFNELLSLMHTLLLSRPYHIIIHSAAVSDYTLSQSFQGKIKSGAEDLHITLKPTVKIVDRIKKWAPKSILVKFKLECGLSEHEIIEIGYKSLLDSQADILVANRYVSEKTIIDYTCIIDKNKNLIKVPARDQLPDILLRKLDSLCTHNSKK